MVGNGEKRIIGNGEKGIVGNGEKRRDRGKCRHRETMENVEEGREDGKWRKGEKEWGIERRG